MCCNKSPSRYAHDAHAIHVVAELLGQVCIGQGHIGRCKIINASGEFALWRQSVFYRSPAEGSDLGLRQARAQREQTSYFTSSVRPLLRNRLEAKEPMEPR